jgi:hypothetical protein
VIAAALAPARASACGGFFCSTTPVQQAGEDIAYAIDDDGSLTMTVRIVYQGAAPDFAWILPLPVEPEAIEVGTDALFDALEDAAAPVFVTEPVTEGECRPEPRCEPPPRPAGAGCDDAPIDECTGICIGDAGPGVDVRSTERVGPYESVVLSGGSADELRDWLVEHGYDIPSSFLPAISDYVAAGQLFVALRLRAEVATGEIQPIAIRMRGAQTCLPIRLTRVATVPDLPIAAYFLARAPAVPTNYSLIEVPADDPLLWSGRRTWASRVTPAVDGAGGQAFVMDYAGPTPAIQIALPSIDDLATASDPAAFFDALIARGYPMDTQLTSIAERHVGSSDSLATRQLVTCLAAGRGTTCGAASTFDPEALVLAIDEAITTPRLAGQAMLDGHATLTRLFTTMSAADMSLDPEFRIDEGIADVSNVRTASLVTECSEAFYPSTAPQRLILPSGRATRFREGVEVEDDEALCARSGMRVASGGCAAATARGGSAMSVALAIGLVVAIGTRRRRRGARGLLTGRGAGGGL